MTVLPDKPLNGKINRKRGRPKADLEKVRTERNCGRRKELGRCKEDGPESCAVEGICCSPWSPLGRKKLSQHLQHNL